MFTIHFSESAVDDLRYLPKVAQNAVLDAVDRLLAARPTFATRDCKPLRPNDLSSWELRVGIHRVFYDVDEQNREVLVKAVGRKEHNKLFIRGQEYTL